MSVPHIRGVNLLLRLAFPAHRALGWLDQRSQIGIQGRPERPGVISPSGNEGHMRMGLLERLCEADGLTQVESI